MLVFACVQDALKLYFERRYRDRGDDKAVLGCMKCLDAMGEWDKLVEMCDEDWSYLTAENVEPKTGHEAAQLAAKYDWVLVGSRVLAAICMRVYYRYLSYFRHSICSNPH